MTSGRFAALRRSHARIALGLLALALLACLSALTLSDPPPLSPVAGETRAETDLALHEKIVAGVKGGENYYIAAADAMRTGGQPLRPFLAVRMPALTVTLASLPAWLPSILLYLLAACVAVAWGMRLGKALPHLLPRIAAALLLLGSLLAFLRPELVALHEIWAGLLVALSLALRRPGRWVEAAAIALAAMLIRETATLYAIVMAAFAWRDGARREAIGWAAAIALFGAVLAVHAYAVTGVTGPLDPAVPGWAGLHGFGLFVKSITLATALQLLPLSAAALLVGLTLFGWAAWNDPLAGRMLAVLAAYAAAIALFARLDAFHWGVIVAPVFLVGLVFVPAGMRDLVRQALDRRRVTVTRVAR